MTTEQYITNAKLVGITGAILFMLSGWLFSIMIDAQQHTRDRVELLAERVSFLEASMESVNRGARCDSCDK